MRFKASDNFSTGGVLKYVEDLKFRGNAEMDQKADFHVYFRFAALLLL